MRFLRERSSHVQSRDYLLRHHPKQLFIKIDTNKLYVSVHTPYSTITIFHRDPSLAEAVVKARQFCRRYYYKVPVLEYNV